MPRILLIIVVGFGLIVAYLRYIEGRSIFFPMKAIEYTPKEIGLAYEDIYFKALDHTVINGWFIPYPNARYTILFCHGNAGNISHRVEKIKFFHELGLNIFVFDYRGYGRSKGRPSEKGLYQDAQGAYNYLLSRGIKPEQIIGYGESIGGVAIINLVSQNKLAAIITEGALSCAKDMVKIIYPAVPYWVFSSRLDALDKIKSVTCPKLIIHSINDEIIPYKLGEKLYAHAPMPKEFLQIHGGHNETFFDSGTILKEKIAGFLKRL